MAYPRAGKHYPGSVGEFQAWFRTDADCLDYLEWLRWPDGFVCPSCGHEGGWRLGDGRFMCPACSTRSSVTAGTIFDRTRTPLTIWYTACWLFATGKDGISALSLKRVLEISSYQTAWAMLHRLRSVLVRPGRDLLSGTVQVDETYIGGAEPGLAGGRARGKKVLTGIAVEVHEPRGLGRCRMSPLADASAETLHAFVMDHVEPGSTIITDGWPAYQGLAQLGYEHDRRSQGAARARGDDPNKLFARRAPRCLTGQAVAAGNASRGRRQYPHEPLPQRVRVPLQSPPLPQPRHGVLSRARAGRGPRADAFPGSHCQPTAEEAAPRAAQTARASHEPGTPRGKPAVAVGGRTLMGVATHSG